MARKFSLNVVVFLSIKSNVLQWDTVFNESIGKKLVEVEVKKVRRSRRGDGCDTFLLTGIGMDACSEQKSKSSPISNADVLVLLVQMVKRTQN